MNSAIKKNNNKIKSAPKYHSPLFRDFRAIEPDDYHRIIRFFEEKESAIGGLDFAEYYDLLLSYVEALYHTGAFRKHLFMVDYAIEAAIRYDAPTKTSDDIFQRLLYQKGMSYYRTLAADKAEHVLKELLRINPWHEDAARLLRRSLYRSQEKIRQKTRAVAILSFGISALIVLIEVLVIRHFYQLFEPATQNLRNLIFVIGWMSLGIGGGYTWWKAHRATESFVQTQMDKKL